MKIAIKAGLATFILLGVGHVSPVQAQQLAQDAAVAAVGAAAAAQVVSQGKAVEARVHDLSEAQIELPKQIADTKSSYAMAETPSPKSAASKSTASGDAPPSLSDDKGKSDKGELSSPKMPESVKNAVKRLSTATEDVTLEDLNAAREAVAKLDILIDIEKRLSDLETIRQEREEKSMSGALPASAFAIPGTAMPVAQVPVASMPDGTSVPMPPMGAVGEVEVTRIVGVAGRYTAMVKIGDGKPTSVRPGDKIDDGSVVQDISSRSVTLLKDKKTRTVDIKDIAVVFNGR